MRADARSGQAAAIAAAIVAVSGFCAMERTPVEYMPRLLYPGTYGNFCECLATA
jgi:hypothetical protein